MVVPVLITSCQVSENPKIGPVNAQIAMTPSALTSAQYVDGMKRLASRLTWWHKAPHEHSAVNAAERRGQPVDHIGIGVHKRESQDPDEGISDRGVVHA